MNDVAKPAAATPAEPESSQDQSLLRDLGLINARTTREQGLAPRGGPRAQPKRKPDLPRRDASKDEGGTAD